MYVPNVFSFAPDKKHRRIQIICRDQQYDTAIRSSPAWCGAIRRRASSATSRAAATLD
jgi:hypothetical protein